MVEKYIPIVSELTKIKAVSLFAALKLDEITDRWSLIIGSDGTESDDKIFKQVVDALYKDLPEEIEDIARIGVFKNTDHLIVDLAKHALKEKIIDTKANGNFVHEGYVLINR